MELTRRNVLMGSALGAAAPQAGAPKTAGPQIILFTKLLGSMAVPEMAKAVKQIGYDGVDLTVRKGGHVDPSQVVTALPEAARVIRENGLSIPMISTELTSASDPNARPVLETARRLRIQHFKTGYWDYGQVPLLERIASIHRDVNGLAALARQNAMVMGIHNHSGKRWGEAVWDIKEAFDRLPRDPSGYYFDPAHATVEGGLGGWQVGLELVIPRLRMLAVKDFLWQKAGSRWKAVWVPLGKGMVQWGDVFARLRKAGYAGPISLHVEYRPADPVAAARADFETLKRLLEA